MVLTGRRRTRTRPKRPSAPSETGGRTAFVLSGGGNRGPLEVGALRALAEAGIQPDFIVGASSGAITGAFVAARGLTHNTLNALEKQWLAVDSKTVYPGSILKAAFRVFRKEDSLYSNAGIRSLIQNGLPQGVSKFGHLHIRLFVPATDLRTNTLYMFGEDPRAPIVDAVLASASVPVIHPPVRYHDLQLVDGGILANVAASYAMDRGASEIYVINVSSDEYEDEYAEGVVDVAFRSINTMIVQSLLRDLARARENESVDLHHIHIGAFSGTWFKDFSHTQSMFKAGYMVTADYLRSPEPLSATGDLGMHVMPIGPNVPGGRPIPIPYP